MKHLKVSFEFACVLSMFGILIVTSSLVDAYPDHVQLITWLAALAAALLVAFVWIAAIAMMRRQRRESMTDKQRQAQEQRKRDTPGSLFRRGYRRGRSSDG